MSGGRPAALEGSLLARKGEAAPAIPDESPLVVNLDERRDANETSADSVEVAPKIVGERISGSDNVDVESAINPFKQTPWLRWLAIAVAAVLAGLILWLLNGSSEPVVETSEVPVTAVPATELAGVESQKLNLDLEPAVSSPVPSDDLPEQSIVRAPAPSLPAAAALLGEAAAEDTQAQPAKALEGNGPSILPVKLSSEEPLQKPSDDQVTAELNTELPKAVSPVPVPKAKPDLVRGAYGVQLASIPIEASAKQEAFRLQKLLAPVLGGKEIRVEQATVSGKGTMYRLRADGFESNTEARATCARVAEFNVSCLAYRQ